MERLFSELERISSELQEGLNQAEKVSARQVLVGVETRAWELNESHSGSWLAGREKLYYHNFEHPPPDQDYSPIEASFGYEKAGWMPQSIDSVTRYVFHGVSEKDLSIAMQAADSCKINFQNRLEDVKSIMQVSIIESDEFLSDKLAQLGKLRLPTEQHLIGRAAPSSVVGYYITAAAGPQTPPHIKLFAKYAAVRHGIDCASELAKIVSQVIAHLNRIEAVPTKSDSIAHRVFIGHGRALDWLVLEKFLKERLNLKVDEFNRVPTGGVSIKERLEQMLDSSCFAFLVLTAEDEIAEGESAVDTDKTRRQARMNVIHEAGLFQGRLGFERAIILLENDCEEFSNIHGVGQIRFDKDKIDSTFYEVQRLLEDRGIISR